MIGDKRKGKVESGIGDARVRKKGVDVRGDRKSGEIRSKAMTRVDWGVREIE